MVRVITLITVITVTHVTFHKHAGGDQISDLGVQKKIASFCDRESCKVKDLRYHVSISLTLLPRDGTANSHDHRVVVEGDCPVSGVPVLEHPRNVPRFHLEDIHGVIKSVSSRHGIGIRVGEVFKPKPFQKHFSPVTIELILTGDEESYVITN